MCAANSERKEAEIERENKEKMTKKVIALFDVDGTLTVPRKQITLGECCLVAASN